jgi:hypothetical protein
VLCVRVFDIFRTGVWLLSKQNQDCTSLCANTSTQCLYQSHVALASPAGFAWVVNRLPQPSGVTCALYERSTGPEDPSIVNSTQKCYLAPLQSFCNVSFLTAQRICCCGATGDECASAPMTSSSSSAAPTKSSSSVTLSSTQSATQLPATSSDQPSTIASTALSTIPQASPTKDSGGPTSSSHTTSTTTIKVSMVTITSLDPVSTAISPTTSATGLDSRIFRVRFRMQLDFAAIITNSSTRDALKAAVVLSLVNATNNTEVLPVLRALHLSVNSSSSVLVSIWLIGAQIAEHTCELVVQRNFTIVFNRAPGARIATDPSACSSERTFDYPYQPNSLIASITPAITSGTA